MSRLSRTSSASSQSYTTIPSSLDNSHNGSMSYYPTHNGPHSRMASISSNGAGAGGSNAYYSHINDDMSSPAALGDGSGNSAMAAVVANQVVADQVAYQHQHQHHDSLAVGMPLGMGQGTPTVMSNGPANGRGGPIRTSNASSVLGSVGSVASSIGSTNSSGHGRSYSVQMPETALPTHMQHHHSLPQMTRTSSGAWSPQDDDTLIQARARGENWAQIQTLFHGKTPNACRKRHERLMERRNANDFDTRKMELIAHEYMNMRREIWQPLALKTGEKWTVVEQKCMTSGLKNLQGVARAAGRRQRLQSAYAVVGPFGANYHDNGPDVGIDDELDVDVDFVDSTGMGTSVRSPSGSSPNGASHGIGSGNRSVSGGSNSSGASSTIPRRHQHSHSHSHSHSYSYPHQQQHQSHAHTQPHHQHALSGSPGEVGSSPGYEYYTPAGFSQSLRAVDTAPAAAMTSPYANHHHHQHQHAQQSHQPRMAGGDMGIDALLLRR